MLGINIFDVMSNHGLKNRYVLQEVGINCMNSFIELRRARWLEKLAHMNSNRAPRQLLGAWLPYPRRNGEAGRAQSTIRHAYACTLSTFGYEEKFNFEFIKWMTHAQDREYWGKLIEEKLNLSKNAYSRKNSKYQAAELKTCDTL